MAYVVNLTGSNQVAVEAAGAGRSVYRGFSIRETSGTASAVVRIYDGTSAAGNILDVVALAPSESAREDYGDWGLPVRLGIYVEVVSGAVEGSVRAD